MHTRTTNRRTVLLGISTLAAGGSALAMLTAEPTEALAVSGLDVQPTSKTLSPSGEVSGVRIDLSIAYEYEASHQPDEVSLTAYVQGPASSSFVELDALTLADPAMTDTGTVSLSGDLLDTEAFTAADFEVAEGQTTTIDLPIKVVMEIRRGGRRIGLADIAETATVTLSREELTVAAQIGGDGSVQVITG